MTVEVLAATVLEIVSRVFRRHSDVARRCFRIKNLQEAEIVSFLAQWKMCAEAAGLAEVRLVVAESLGGAVPPEHVAEKDRSITYYRNNNSNGLVYLETSVQSDEQGLRNLFTIRDSNFLDHSFDDYARDEHGVPGLVLVVAWRRVGESASPVPSLLRERVLLVTRLVHPQIEPLPVRRFVRFVEETCRQWSAHREAIDADAADRIVGRCLWVLELFPDPRWRNSGADGRVARRLEVNARHAELVGNTGELDPEEIAAAAASTRFLDESGIAIEDVECRRLAGLCADYARNPVENVRRDISYTIFEQLFRRDTAGLRLGDKVRSEINEGDTARLAELDGADVVDGLNARAQADAERFLGLAAPAGGVALADLLTPRTRKTVERVASPPARTFFHPAIEIVRFLERVNAQASTGERPARIELELATPPEDGNAALGLFAFLFGSSLVSVEERVRGIPGACELVVSDQLRQRRDVPEVDGQGGEQEQGATEAVCWEPIVVRLRALDSGGTLLEEMDNLRWEPEDMGLLALFWLLSADATSPFWREVGALSYQDVPEDDHWYGALVRRVVPLTAIERVAGSFEQGRNSLSDELLSARQELRQRLAAEGLVIEALDAFTDIWQGLLGRIREDHVPDGTRPPILEAFLGDGMIQVQASGRHFMLPLHPIRLRWIARYNERCVRLAVDCLVGQRGFATGDGLQYLSWLEGMSPHESPPTAIGEGGEILFARTESGWFEEFARLETAGEPAADASTDPRALDAIASRVTAYLEAHPHKRDGLGMLLLLPPSDTMPAELTKRILRAAMPGLRIGLTVAAPRARWENIARQLERLPSEDRGGARGGLFPAKDLAFLEYSPGDDTAMILKGTSFDLAIVSHLLQDRVESQMNTEPPTRRAGAFDPVTDRPVRLESGGQGGSISVVMRPRDPDEILDSWGTLVVRSNRACPVSASQPENIDYVALLVRFQDSARVFHALHAHSHWVVTLEKLISREQIESVEAGAPDVLSMETGVGSNGLSTLIVSSSSGRRLIESRLSKKLGRLASTPDSRVPPGELIALAGRLYDETRTVAPRLALQALGVARVTEEIVGLSIARHVADQQIPPCPGEGLVAWISLDEHAEWLGGASGVRADMFRIVLRWDPTRGLEVDVLILEGKLRQNYDTHGERQVERTIEFFTSVLKVESEGGGGPVDAGMWRGRILASLETISPDARRALGHGVASGIEEGLPIPEEIRQLFRDGHYRLSSVRGLYSVCLWDSPDSRIHREDRGALTIVRSARNHILELVKNPTPSVADESATPGLPLGESDPAPGSTVHEPTWAAGASSTADGTSGSPSPDSPSTVEKPVPELIASTSIRRGMADSALTQTYNEILACFDAYHVSVSAAARGDQPYIEGPASVLFRVRAGVGVDPRKLFEKSQALKLHLGLEQDQNVSFDIDRGYVTIDVPKRTEDRYYVDAAFLWRGWARPQGELSVVLGEDRFGAPVKINFTSPNSPHLLVAGTTGSGKSEALNTILFGLVRSCSPAELRLLLVDPKGTELTALEGSSYLDGTIGLDDSDALSLVRRAVEEMQRRYAVFRAAGKRSLVDFNSAVPAGDRIPWWLIVLDEYADLTSDPQAKKDIEQELKRLAQKARAAGIHLIIATQKPSAEVISTNLRSNLGAQLALRVKSATESRVILDETGAENLNGRGDALFKADGRTIRVQCARVAPEDQFA